MRRHRIRITAVVLGVLVLLPAGAAHASLPLDPAAKTAQAAAAQPAASGDDDADSADEGDDQASDDTAAQDDDSSSDASDASDDSSSSDASDDVPAADQGAVEEDAPSAAAKSRSGSASAAKHRSTARALRAPRGVRVRLAAFDRAVVSWRPGNGVTLTRWVVTLRSGGSGRLLYLGRRARSATFTALKPGVRYTATVTATASGGRAASASSRVRTPTLKKAVRTVAQEQARLERAARLAKVQRFG